MNHIIGKLKHWRYLQGDFLYRVHFKGLRKAIEILMAVVIGALVLAGLYLLFDKTVLPTLTKRVQDMFNYAG